MFNNHHKLYHQAFKDHRIWEVILQLLLMLEVINHNLHKLFMYKAVDLHPDKLINKYIHSQYSQLYKHNQYKLLHMFSQVLQHILNNKQHHIQLQLHNMYNQHINKQQLRMSNQLNKLNSFNNNHKLFNKLLRIIYKFSKWKPTKWLQR